MELGLRAGMTLGRYVLDEHAASGGMGVVFRARQLGAHGFERTVAVKTIHPALVADSTNRHRLIDEARLAAAIHHDNVVEVLDVQDEDGLLFLVLEWIDGLSVRALLRRQAERGEALSSAVAVRVVADMLDGLHHAHELTDGAGRPRDLVHRDVSPDNAIIARNGTTKLIDFGLARASDRLASVTESGAVMGKVSYMPPEQARGEKVDRRADLWAVGVILRLCITGELAHGATSDIQRLYMLSVGQQPDPLPSGTPPFLGPILARALAVDRAERFPTAAAFRAALIEAAPQVATREEVAAILAEPLRERAAAIAVRAAATAPAVDEVTRTIPPSVDALTRTVAAPGVNALTRTVAAPPPEKRIHDALAFEVTEASLGAVIQSRPAPSSRRRPLPLAAALVVGAIVTASALTLVFVRARSSVRSATPAAEHAEVAANAVPGEPPPLGSEVASALAAPPPSGSVAPASSGATRPPAASGPEGSPRPTASARPRPAGAKPTASVRDYGF